MSPPKKKRREYIGASGDKFVGVTTVIGLLAKPALYRWYYDNGVQGRPFGDKREADLGTVTHALADARRTGEVLDTHSYSPDLLERARVLDGRVAAWEQESGLVVEASEAAFVDDDLCIGGTIDIIGMVAGERWLLDIKTGSGVYDEVSIQFAAYRHLWNKHRPTTPIARCGVLHVPAKGSGAALVPLTSENLDEGMRVFRSLVDVYYRKEKLRIERPTL